MKDLSKIKERLFEFWKNKGVNVSWQFAKMIGIPFDDLQEMVVEFFGGDDEYLKLISKEIVGKKFEVLDGGYNFEFRVEKLGWWDKNEIVVYVTLKGTVQLIMIGDPRTYDLDNLWSYTNLSHNTQSEIDDEIGQILHDTISPLIKKYIPNIYTYDWKGISNYEEL